MRLFLHSYAALFFHSWSMSLSFHKSYVALYVYLSHHHLFIINFLFLSLYSQNKWSGVFLKSKWSNSILLILGFIEERSPDNSKFGREVCKVWPRFVPHIKLGFSQTIRSFVELIHHCAQSLGQILILSIWIETYLFKET